MTIHLHECFQAVWLPVKAAVWEWIYRVLSLWCDQLLIEIYKGEKKTLILFYSNQIVYFFPKSENILVRMMESVSSNNVHVVIDNININRHQVNSFKTSSAKHAPFEKLDFSIYKASAKLVAFSSTEERLPLWIQAMDLQYKHGNCRKQ